jgi:hypothetical protein
MSTWFGKKLAGDRALSEGYDSPPMPEVKPAKVSEDGYTVGVNNEGSTVLKITTGYSTSTLTMNEVGTRRLIKLLQATLAEEDEECQV